MISLQDSIHALACISTNSMGHMTHSVHEIPPSSRSPVGREVLVVAGVAETAGAAKGSSDYSISVWIVIHTAASDAEEDELLRPVPTFGLILTEKGQDRKRLRELESTVIEESTRQI